jgi:hypothetical protein
MFSEREDVNFNVYAAVELMVLESCCILKKVVSLPNNNRSKDIKKQ